MGSLSRWLVAGTLAVIGMQTATHAMAQADVYPSKPIRITVGFPPGGASDTTVRLAAAALQKQLGQPVIIENRPGASGAVAAKAVAAMAPDGYNLFYATSSSHAIAPHLNAKLGYDPVKDFTPVIPLSRGGLVLTANKTVPAGTVADVAAMARARPGEVTYASPGLASSQHLAMVMFSQVNRIEMSHVPYKGSAPGLTDLIGGQVQFMIDNVTAPLPHIRAGTIKAIAVTGLERSPLLPDVPTMNESGLKGFDVQAWGGIVAPAGTPVRIVELLNRELNKALEDPAVRQSIIDGGGRPQGGSTSDFAAFIARESGKWKSVIETAGIKGE